MAQDGEGLPTEHVRLVPPGAWIDLDTGLVLPTATFRKDKADLQFDRDGGGFYLLPLHGGCRAAAQATQPPDTLPTERVRLGRHESEAWVLFVRTDRGMARVELMVADAYSTASAALRWVVVPPKSPTFLPAPVDLEAKWNGDALEVSWHGDEPRWLVEVDSAGQTQKLTLDVPRASLRNLSPDQRHRIVVRGLAADNTVSMPADVVQFGRKRPPLTGAVEYPDRWYDGVGGLALARGEAATEDADVVFYLYGVTVPGGGVRKVGEGEAVFHALSRLPAGAYPPVYGRLDDHDVYAVRTADGRFAKVWLEPTKNGDVRSGMRVHYVFLQDGRRTLLAPPAELQSDDAKDGVRLRWRGEAGPTFRVSVDDRVVYEGKEAAVDLPGLARDRVFAAEVRAVGADGEVSAPARTIVHTFGPTARFQRVQLGHDESLVFATGVVGKGAGGDLAITSSAGGASYLEFTAAGGVAKAGDVAFGDFAAAARLEFANTFGSDNRNAGADRFFVRTKDGGFAAVRLLVREYPTSEIEYLWLPKR